LVSELAPAVALRAGCRLRSWRSARAAAGLACFMPRDLNRGLDALSRFVERDLEVVTEIGSALRSAAPTAATEHVADAEDVAETAKDVLEAGEYAWIESARRCAPESGVSEPVVHVAFVGVGEHRIRFGGLLETLFSSLVTGIAIGMVLKRQLAVCA